MAGVNDNLIPPVKGEVRNPNGRPKGSKNLATLIRELEREDYNWDLIPIKQKDAAKAFGSPWKAIIGTAIAKAYSGDVRAAEWLRKAGYGDKVVHDFEESLFTKGKLEIKIVADNAAKPEPETEDGA